MNRLLVASLFTITACGFSLLGGQPIANADSPTDVAPSSTGLSLATEALRDGDDVRARFILALQADQSVQSAMLPALSPATAALADGDDVRARFILTLQH
jgi:hypothetical protein